MERLQHDGGHGSGVALVAPLPVRPGKRLGMTGDRARRISGLHLGLGERSGVQLLLESLVFAFVGGGTARRPKETP